MTPLRKVMRKSFGSWTAEPKLVANLPVVGARNSTQSTGSTARTREQRPAGDPQRAPLRCASAPAAARARSPQRRVHQSPA